jgi:hypothetical protein
MKAAAGLPNHKHSGFEHDFVEVAPHPVFAGLDRLDNRVLGVVKVFGGVFIFGGVAAANVPAFTA